MTPGQDQWHLSYPSRRLPGRAQRSNPHPTCLQPGQARMIICAHLPDVLVRLNGPSLFQGNDGLARTHIPSHTNEATSWPRAQKCAVARFCLSSWPGSSLKPVSNGRQSGQGPVVEQHPVHPRLWPGSTASSIPNDVQLGQVHPNTNAHVKGNLARSTVHTCPQGTLALARVIISTLFHSSDTLARVKSLSKCSFFIRLGQGHLNYPSSFAHHLGQGLLHVSIH